jgi:FkbM family methyltransferase
LKRYSQKNEQDILFTEMEAGRLPQLGRFLDIGAFDGETFSNTCALLKSGWRGVMVEPGVAAFKQLLERHGRDQRVHLIHAAIGDAAFTSFWENGAYSTTEPRQRFVKFPSTGEWSQPFVISQLSVHELMNAWGMFYGLGYDPDVVSIDTEGTTLDLFNALTRVCRPKVMIVEHDQNRVTWEAVEFCGYDIISENDENLIMRRKGHGV